MKSSLKAGALVASVAVLSVAAAACGGSSAAAASGGGSGPCKPADTPVLTTVHDLQVVDTAISMTPHDVPVDLIVTPTRTIRPKTRRPKPQGIRWNELTEPQIAAMPVLKTMRR